jgi:2-keto-4-pentenoate hydratase/2-oxohepta-3-ene-1,7-dioic acid hydratase in catechol pathway
MNERKQPMHTKFGLGMFHDGSQSFCGMVLGEPGSEVVPIRALLPMPQLCLADSVDALLARWPAILPRLIEAADSLTVGTRVKNAARRKLADLRTEAPIAPRQILQAGANYRKHVVDLMVAQKTLWPAGMSEAEFRLNAARLLDARTEQAPPYVFAGLPSALSGPNDDVVLPRLGAQHDWELELAVVMGGPAYRVPREQAYSVVAGYTIANDITTRDRVYRPDLPSIGTDWVCAKNAPTFLPLGPLLVPACFVERPMDLRITLRVGGELMQNETTADMLYDIPRLIEHVTSYVKLSAGDLLLTGSPAGNGAHYGRFLRAGDVMEGAIEGLGVQRNRVVAE